MQVVFHSPEDADTIVATATWDGEKVTVESFDDAVRERLLKAFRPTPVVVDDASYRPQGTSGEVVMTPGSMEWFRTAAQVRVLAEAGFAARFIPGVTEGGYDPAAGNRSFSDSISRLTTPDAG